MDVVIRIVAVPELDGLTNHHARDMRLVDTALLVHYRRRRRAQPTSFGHASFTQTKTFASDPLFTTTSSEATGADELSGSRIR